MPLGCLCFFSLIKGREKAGRDSNFKRKSVGSLELLCPLLHGRLLGLLLLSGGLLGLLLLLELIFLSLAEGSLLLFPPQKKKEVKVQERFSREEKQWPTHP